MSEHDSGWNSAGQRDAGNGEVRLEGLPAGTFEVRGYCGLANATRTTVLLEAGQERLLDLVYDGPAPESVLHVLATYVHLPIFNPAAEFCHLIGPDGIRISAVESRGRFAFEGLGVGPFELVVDDPRFETFTQSDVATNQILRRRLLGSAAITIEVVDGETGDRIPRFGLSGTYLDPPATPHTFVLWDASKAAPSRFDGLVPHPMAFEVQVPGRPNVTVRTEDLRAGEAVSLRVEIPPALPIEGRVVLAPGMTGFRDVVVEWTPGRVHGHHEGARSLRRSGVDIPPVGEVIQVSSSGRFRIEVPGPGEQALRVRWGKWLWKDLIISGGREDPLVIEPPAATRLQGRVITPEGTAEEFFGTLNFPDEPRQLDPRSREWITVRPDGTFDEGPILTGRVHVLVNEDDPHGGDTKIMARLNASPGEVLVWDADLRVNHPGRIRVKATVNGEARDWGTVRGFCVDRSVPNPPADADLDHVGRTQLYPVPLGSWKLVVRSRDGWIHQHPELVEIAPLEVLDVTLEIPLTTRRVRIVDAQDGTPLANQDVPLGGHDRGHRFVTTDEQGTFELSWLDGPVTFWRGGGREAPQVEHTWGPGDGALEIALPPRE